MKHEAQTGAGGRHEAVLEVAATAWWRVGHGRPNGVLGDVLSGHLGEVVAVGVFADDDPLDAERDRASRVGRWLSHIECRFEEEG